MYGLGKAGEPPARLERLPPDGSKRIDGEIAGEASQAEQLGKDLANQLLARGAK